MGLAVTRLPDLGSASDDASDDAEGLEETLAIMEDGELMESLKRSRREAADGKIVLLSERL